MRYEADEAGMQEYSRIISALSQLDLQRERYMQMLADWEKAHQVAEDEAPAEVPQEPA